HDLSNCGQSNECPALVPHLRALPVLASTLPLMGRPCSSAILLPVPECIMLRTRRRPTPTDGTEEVEVGVDRDQDSEHRSLAKPQTESQVRFGRPDIHPNRQEQATKGPDHDPLPRPPL